MANNVNLNDIALAAGVSRSTVSLALKNHPRISEPVRRKIQALAREMGYRVNPLVAALMEARRRGKTAGEQVIAYITNYPTRWGWRPPDHDRPDYFPGAARRAQELGFRLEHFWLGEPGMSSKRFCEILSNRAIHGAIIGRLPPGLDTIDLQWDRFSCVAVGRTLRKPRLHYVTEDHHAGAVLAMRRLRALGYRRIGFVFSEPDDSPEVGDRWIGGYLREQLRLNAADRLPPFLFKENVDHPKAFGAWLKRGQPDAILVPQAAPVFSWIKSLGKRAPKNLGIATLVNDHLDRHWAGIHSCPAQIGALAVDMVVGMMSRCERGLPATPHEVLLCGEWIQGETLPSPTHPASSRNLSSGAL